MLTSALSRRALLFGATAVLAAGGYAAFAWIRPELPEGVIALTVQQVHHQAKAGDIVLIDIRRPDEWSRTGIGEGAQPLDMRRKDFIAALDLISGNDRSRPVALICARGVRSARMTARLTEAGYTRIIDVPEGMLGSRAGPGWISAKLPVRRP